MERARLSDGTLLALRTGAGCVALSAAIATPELPGVIAAVGDARGSPLRTPTHAPGRDRAAARRGANSTPPPVPSTQRRSEPTRERVAAPPQTSHPHPPSAGREHREKSPRRSSRQRK